MRNMIRSLFVLLALTAILPFGVPVLAQQTPTAPEATIEPVAEMPAVSEEPAAEAETEAEAEPVRVPTAHIRIAHLSMDTPSLNIYMNDEPTDIQTVSYKDLTGWVEVPVGTYRIAGVALDSALENALFQTQISLRQNTWVTIAAIGSSEEGTLSLKLIYENYTRTPLNTARLSIVHAIPNAPAVDVIVNGDMIPVQNLAYTGAVTVDVPAGTHDIQVVATGTTEPALVELTDFVVSAGDYIFHAVVGSADMPEQIVSTISTAQVTVFQPDSVGNILEVLEEDGRFTTFLAALKRTNLATQLSTSSNFTVLAPVDAAFANHTASEINAHFASALESYIIHETLPSQDFLALSEVEAASGAMLMISLDDRGAFVNETAQIIITDLPASNGVIHGLNNIITMHEAAEMTETGETDAE